MYMIYSMQEQEVVIIKSIKNTNQIEININNYYHIHPTKHINQSQVNSTKKYHSLKSCIISSGAIKMYHFHRTDTQLCNMYE